MATDATPGPSTPTLSIIVPTYQKSANIPVLFECVKVALDGLPWEMIVVDDNSPDGTSNVAFALAAKDHRLRCLRRVNRSGLAGAVIEGWMSSSADFVAVIDGDLQHDESVLRVMYQVLAKGAGNLVIGTRLKKATGGSLSPARQRLSDMGAWFFRRIAGAAVADPMSGFFMIRREIVSRLAPSLSPDGFKILVDVILSAGGELKIIEVPYRFRKRNAGEFQTDAAGWHRLPWVGRSSRHRGRPSNSLCFVRHGWSKRSRRPYRNAFSCPSLVWRVDLRFWTAHRHRCCNGKQLHTEQ